MYMSPSPLCVLLTLCCDDVHSDGGGGKVLLGRGLGHDCAGWDTTAVETGFYHGKTSRINSTSF